MIEPKHLGASENLVLLSGGLRDNEIFENRHLILPLFYQSEKIGEQAARFLSAAGGVLNDTYRMVLDVTDIPKIGAFTGRVAAKELKKISDTRGKETVRFLSAFTGDGHILFDSTIAALASNIYLIEDEFGACSKLILCSIRAKAMELGYDVISCYCPLSPFDRIEHLFIPALSLAFVTSGFYHKPTINPDKVVNARRFTGLDELKRYKKRIAFNKKASVQLLEQAQKLLADAKTVHDEIEVYYKNAMDFTIVDAKTEALIGRIEKIYHENFC